MMSMQIFCAIEEHQRVDVEETKNGKVGGMGRLRGTHLDVLWEELEGLAVLFVVILEKMSLFAVAHQTHRTHHQNLQE